MEKRCAGWLTLISICVVIFSGGKKCGMNVWFPHCSPRPVPQKPNTCYDRLFPSCVMPLGIGNPVAAGFGNCCIGVRLLPWGPLHLSVLTADGARFVFYCVAVPFLVFSRSVLLCIRGRILTSIAFSAKFLKLAQFL